MKVPIDIFGGDTGTGGAPPASTGSRMALNTGNSWTTARKAQKRDFITGSKGTVKTDQKTANAGKQSGPPTAIAQGDSVKPNLKVMDVKATAITLGMDPDSTEAQVDARLAANAKKAKNDDPLKAGKDRKEKAAKAGKKEKNREPVIEAADKKFKELKADEK